MFLLYHVLIFIEIVLWTDLVSLSRKASVSTLLTGTHVSLVKKTDQAYNQLKGNSCDSVVGNVNS